MHTSFKWCVLLAFTFPDFGGKVKWGMLTSPCPSALEWKSLQGFYVANSISVDRTFKKDFWVRESNNALKTCMCTYMHTYICTPAHTRAHTPDTTHSRGGYLQHVSFLANALGSSVGRPGQVGWQWLHSASILERCWAACSEKLWVPWRALGKQTRKRCL